MASIVSCKVIPLRMVLVARSQSVTTTFQKAKPAYTKRSTVAEKQRTDAKTLKTLHYIVEQCT
ncbi:MAG: hypothetical protein ACP5OR_09365, partial [Candidatus Dormibacteria bacterium]